MSQTIPIDGDPNFIAIDSHIDFYLNRNSGLRSNRFKRLERKGSTSWEDSKIRPKDSAVRYKLCYFGPQNIAFGVRKEMAEKQGVLDKINCQLVFTVSPSDVEFVGFIATNDPGSFLRIDEVINFFP